MSDATPQGHHQGTTRRRRVSGLSYGSAPLGGDEPGAEREAPEAHREAGGRLGP